MGYLLLLLLLFLWGVLKLHLGVVGGFFQKCYIFGMIRCVIHSIQKVIFCKQLNLWFGFPWAAEGQNSLQSWHWSGCAATKGWQRGSTSLSATEDEIQRADSSKYFGLWRFREWHWAFFGGRCSWSHCEWSLQGPELFLSTRSLPSCIL